MIDGIELLAELFDPAGVRRRRAARRLGAGRVTDARGRAGGGEPHALRPFDCLWCGPRRRPRLRRTGDHFRRHPRSGAGALLPGPGRRVRRLVPAARPLRPRPSWRIWPGRQSSTPRRCGSDGLPFARRDRRARCRHRLVERRPRHEGRAPAYDAARARSTALATVSSPWRSGPHLHVRDPGPRPDRTVDGLFDAASGCSHVPRRPSRAVPRDRPRAGCVPAAVRPHRLAPTRRPASSRPARAATEGLRTDASPMVASSRSRRCSTSRTSSAAAMRAAGFGDLVVARQGASSSCLRASRSAGVDSPACRRSKDARSPRSAPA